MNTKRKIPGSIIKRKTSSGRVYLYYKTYKTNTVVASGLENSVQNRRIVEDILRHAYVQFLKNNNRIPDTPDACVLTFAETFSLFKNEMLKRGLSPYTQKHYEISYNRIISNPDKIISEFEIEAQVKDFLRRRTDLQPASVNIFLREFQVFVNFCSDKKQKYIPKMSVYKDYRLKASKKKVEIYSDEEVNLLFVRATQHDAELGNLLQFLYYTGFRISEALELQLENIDLENRLIAVPNKIQKQEIEFVPITKFLMDILENQIALAKNNNRESLFRWKRSSKSRLTRTLNKIQEGGDLNMKHKGRAFHSFRKTFATKLFDVDLTDTNIQDLIRHRDIELTKLLYRKNNAKKLLPKIDEVFQNN